MSSSATLPGVWCILSSHRPRRERGFDSRVFMLSGLPYLRPECDCCPVGAYIHKGCRFASLTRPIFLRGRISIAHLLITQGMEYPQLTHWYWLSLLNFLLRSVLCLDHIAVLPLPVPNSYLFLRNCVTHSRPSMSILMSGMSYQGFFLLPWRFSSYLTTTNERLNKQVMRISLS